MCTYARIGFTCGHFKWGRLVKACETDDCIARRPDVMRSRKVEIKCHDCSKTNDRIKEIRKRLEEVRERVEKMNEREEARKLKMAERMKMAGAMKAGEDGDEDIDDLTMVSEGEKETGEVEKKSVETEEEIGEAEKKSIEAKEEIGEAEEKSVETEKKSVEAKEEMDEAEKKSLEAKEESLETETKSTEADDESVVVKDGSDSSETMVGDEPELVVDINDLLGETY